MGKTVTTEYFCDRCKGPLKKEAGFIIENVSMTFSGYDPRGSGGHTRAGMEFCYSCSRELNDWLTMKDTPPR